MISDNLAKEIVLAKKELDDCLVQFLKDYKGKEQNEKDVQRLINSLVSKHTEVLNIINNSTGKTHQDYDFFESKDLQSDYLATVENFIPSSIKVYDIVDKLINKHKLLPISFDEKRYITIQKLVNTFSSKSKRTELLKEFESRDISIIGFQQKFKRVNKKLIKVQLVVGIPLLIISLVIIFAGELYLNKKFNGMQLIALRAILALSISLIGSSLIQGNVKTSWNIVSGVTLTAVGWVAVFLLLYFINPANPGDVH